MKYTRKRQWSNFTNSAQGVNFKKLDHFIIDNVFESKQKRSSFLEFTPCAELVKLSQGDDSVFLPKGTQNKIIID